MNVRKGMGAEEAGKGRECWGGANGEREKQELGGEIGEHRGSWGRKGRGAERVESQRGLYKCGLEREMGVGVDERQRDHEKEVEKGVRFRWG